MLYDIHKNDGHIKHCTLHWHLKLQPYTCHILEDDLQTSALLKSQFSLYNLEEAVLNKLPLVSAVSVKMSWR